jgi:hypothetical protein
VNDNDAVKAIRFAMALANFECQYSECRASDGDPCAVCEAKYYLRQNGFHCNASGRWVPPSEQA